MNGPFPHRFLQPFLWQSPAHHLFFLLLPSKRLPFPSMFCHIVSYTFMVDSACTKHSTTTPRLPRPGHTGTLDPVASLLHWGSPPLACVGFSLETFKAWRYFSILWLQHFAQYILRKSNDTSISIYTVLRHIEMRK